MTALQGTQNILDLLHPDLKNYFSIQVYEGLKKVKLDIKENEETCPILEYAKSKNENEKQLKIQEKICYFKARYCIWLLCDSMYGYNAEPFRK